jgi:hypothetical protein
MRRNSTQQYNPFKTTMFRRRKCCPTASGIEVAQLSARQKPVGVDKTMASLEGGP